jgi:hydrogenase expression/formation protein HypE
MNSSHGPIGIEAGDGLAASSDLLRRVLQPILGLPKVLEDGHRFTPTAGDQVITTDIYSVEPIEFPGGDIGTLAACGSINDLAVSGAQMTYCSLGIYASAQLELSRLEAVLQTFAGLIHQQGAAIVCGDTKVHPDRMPELLLFVTAVGSPWDAATFDLTGARQGDQVIVTGALGDHSIAVLSAREGLGFESVVSSDVRPLCAPLARLAPHKGLHAVRDLTRGGLTAALWDLYEVTGLAAALVGTAMPVAERTQAAADMLGLDPLTLTNEGCALIIVGREASEEIIRLLHQYPETSGAVVIGELVASDQVGPTVRAEDGSSYVLPLPRGIGVPRLC